MAVTPQNNTAVVDGNSPLLRKQWMVEGLVKKAHESFFAPYTGNSSESIIYQINDMGKDNGDNITFDYDGYLSGEGFYGKEQAYGKGEVKRKFSDGLTIVMGRYAVKNGNKFDANQIAAMNLTEFGDSRDKLLDLWLRNKDQMIFDVAQGFRGSAPTHILRPNARTLANIVSTDVMSLDFLVEIERVAEEGRGFTSGSDRAPLLPGSDGMYTLFIDSAAASQLRLDTDFKAIMPSADTRGEGNIALTGVLGEFGALRIVKAPNFFGSSSSTQLFKTATERAGLRTIDASNGAFQGTSAYVGSSGIIVSRCILMGKGAIKFAMGMSPDFKIKGSQDFDIDSESAIELWVNAGKTQLVAETEDYTDAKIAAIDWNLMAIDVYNKG